MSIAFLQLLELDSDDTGKGGANQSALKRGFTQASGEKVNVVHTAVYLKGKTVKICVLLRFLKVLLPV